MKAKKKLLRVLGRIEGELVEIRKLSHRVALLSNGSTGSKAAWPSSPSPAPTCGTLNKKEKPMFEFVTQHQFWNRRGDLLDLFRRGLFHA